MDTPTQISPPPVEGFVGNFRHAVDLKSRLTIPAEWRSADGGDTFLSVPHDGYLAVLPPDAVQVVRAKVMQKALTDTQAQITLNRFFSRAAKLVCDKQGRVLLPESQLTAAGIEKGKDVVLNGTLTKFGIWSPERWAKVEQGNEEDYADAMRQLGI